MNEPQIVATVERDESGLRVLAPAVGEWSAMPAPGSFVGPGARIGTLRRLNRRFRLIMPHDVAGRVADGLPATRVAAVGYGDTLFRLAPLEVDEATGVAPGAGAVAADVGPGLRAVVAPTDGVFYCRPSPEAPPYAAPGSTVVTGQPVGLVEVMKTFNQILFEGNVPDDVEVLEVRCSSGEEVKAGAVLLVVR